MSIRLDSVSRGDERSASGSDSERDELQSGDDIDTIFARHSAAVLSRFALADGPDSAAQVDGGDTMMNQVGIVKGDKETIVGDLERLRKWKDRSQREVFKLGKEKASLTAEVEALKEKSSMQAAEVETASERYRALLDEKVALAEQLSGQAKLPLEILLNIAGFVVGNNHASFSLMSKRIREETKAVLYETIMAYGSSYLDSGSGTQAYLDAKRYAKFLYCRTDDHLKGLKNSFPGLRCVIQSNCPARNPKKAHNAHISILRPVRSATLNSLLQHSAFFGSDPVSKCQVMQSISYARLFGKGSLLEDQPSSEGYSFGNQSRTCRIRTDKTRDRDSFQQSILELVRFMPAVPKEIEEHRPSDILHRVTVLADAAAELDLWIITLPAILRKQPRTLIEFNVDGPTELSRPEFQEKFMLAVKAYRNVSREIKDDIARLALDDGETVFELKYATNRWSFDGNHSEDEDGEEFTMVGELEYDRAKNSLKIVLAEENDEEESLTILSVEPLFDQDGSAAE